MASGEHQSRNRAGGRDKGALTSRSSDYGLSWNVPPNNLNERPLSLCAGHAKKKHNRETRDPSGWGFVENSNSGDSSPHGVPKICTSQCPPSAPRTRFTQHSLNSLDASKLRMTFSDLDETSSERERKNMQRRQRETQCQEDRQMSAMQTAHDSRGTASNSRQSIQSNRPASHKQDNINKVPDTGVIVERLMHLRECIKQVASIMQNLEKSDEPVTREQMHKLEDMLEQLRQDEQEHLELLQQLLAAREDISTSETQSTSNTASPNVTGRKEKAAAEAEDSSPLDKRNQLLKKMIDSQEKLAALKEQQEMLMFLQKKAEYKLAEARIYHEPPDRDEGWNKDHGNDHKSGNSLKMAESGQVHDSTVGAYETWNDLDSDWGQAASAYIPVSVKNEESQNYPVEEEARCAAPSVGEIERSVHQKLQLLKEITDHTQKGEELVEDVPEEVVSWHKNKFENKLIELQEKKNQMDQLLRELSGLQGGNVLETQIAVKVNQSASQSSSADSTLQEAQQLLDSYETREKMKKLEHMKKTLQQLRTMVDNLQDPEVPEFQDYFNQLPKDNRQETKFLGPSSQALTHSDARQAPLPPSRQVKKDNLRRDQQDRFPARRHYEAEGSANEESDNITGQGAVSQPPPSVTQNPSETDLEMQDKVRKLQAAKDKLQKLQGLLSTVQQSKDTGETVPQAYVQVLDSLKAEHKPNVQEAHDGFEKKTRHQQQGVTKLTEVGDYVEQQQQEGEQLEEERYELLTMQEQLSQLQQHLPGEILQNYEQRSSGEGGSLKRDKNYPSSVASQIKPEASGMLNVPDRQDNLVDLLQNSVPGVTGNRSRSESLSNKKDVNLPKNLPVRTKCKLTGSKLEGVAREGMEALASLGAELDRSLSLRDELRKQKSMLEELLRQERTKQLGYTQNQDHPSRSGSSVKSEPVEGSNSVLAPDTTAAATWGGSSTQDNLEDEAEETLESPDEHDDDEGGDSENGALSSACGGPDFNLYPSRQRRLPDQFNWHEDKSALNSHSNFEWIRGKNVDKSAYNPKTKLSQNYGRAQESVEVVRESERETDQQQSIGGTQNTTSPPGWQHFSRHIQNQLDQTNNLCQSILRDQQALTNIFMSSHPSAGTGRPGLGVPFLPENLQQYSQQLQQQQQLILNLTQCYHTLYLQQLEIQSLQHFLQQYVPSPDGTHARASPANNQGGISEELTFRPHLYSTQGNSYVVPSSIPTLVPLATQGFLSLGQNIHHPSSQLPLFGLEHATQTSTAVIAPSQGERTETETLNNKVAPGTRANNFWDNFRSYSRQNLLSTSTGSKSNETSSGRAVAGRTRTRQDTTSASLPDIFNAQHRTHLLPDVSVGTSTLPEERLYDRPLPNPELQELMSQPTVKTANFNRVQTEPGWCQEERIRRTVESLNLASEQGTRPSTGSSTGLQNPCSITGTFSSPSSVREPSAINMSSPYHPNQPSKILDLDSGSDPSFFDAVKGMIYSEVAVVISQNERHPRFLIDLFQQLKHLNNNYQREQALTVLRDLALLGRAPETFPSTTGHETKNKEAPRNWNYSQNKLSQSTQKVRELKSQIPEHGKGDTSESKTSLLYDQSFASSSLGETAIHLDSEDFKDPTENISPSHSTGARQKRPQSDGAVAASANASEGTVKQLESQVEKIVLDLVPFLRHHLQQELTPQLQGQLCNRVLGTLHQPPHTRWHGSSEISFCRSFSILWLGFQGREYAGVKRNL
ncbi:uncharacterized protein LOC143230219 isoform X2 [Tachypleus tridentatus]|uniref:uncharacterized protein LOC143230219 isoform X2 n=1 Tax=Tachypleus tridentatus TaxID=6853 RepID=UPI003FD3A481